MPIDLQLVSNPIQICFDESTCANSTLQNFEAERSAIWAQAGIDIHFPPFQTSTSPADYELNISQLDRTISDTRFGPSSFAPRS